MRIQGTIIAHDSNERTIQIDYRKRRHTIYFQRATYNKYHRFLDNGFHIALDAKIIAKKRGKQLTATHVLKISKPRPYGTKTLYSFASMRDETRKFINSLDTKLFLDFEMSMHPYKKNPRFTQEIIQAGYILEDREGNIIKEYSAYIKPTRHKTLSRRTTKFLDLTQEDVDQGIGFLTFYNEFKTLLETYRPAIIVWGKNDHLALKDSYKVNKVRSLGRLTRFVNLLKLHKNVFNYKDDIGLKTAYEMYGNNLKTQRHDALEDAYMTKRVFDGFKASLNR